MTTVRDQNGCSACWAFATTALIESMVRIEHSLWCKRSEGDLHKGTNARCANGGWPENALNWIIDHGLADPDCFTWTTADIPYTPTSDRNGRTTKLSQNTRVGEESFFFITLGENIETQKRWLDNVGPLIAIFEVFEDFDYFFWHGTGVYNKLFTFQGNPNRSRGLHAVLIIGYDDDRRCWIAKNSWGPNGGENGFFSIGYGECDIDTFIKTGTMSANPDPWTKRRLHNGNIIESGNGTSHRNFEMVATSNGGHIRHWWRENSAPQLSWNQGIEFGEDADVCPTFIQTTFNRNFEMIYLSGKRLHHRFFNQSNGQWIDGGIFGPNDAAGIPGFIQSNYGAPGNFEVVVKTSDGKLNHWWRMNGPPWTWHDGGKFGDGILLSGATLVQSRFGNHGNLEVVCVLNSGQMKHYWRDDDHGFVWKDGPTFGNNIGSPPCMIEGQYGSSNEDRVGNFELCVASGGEIQHWWRNNQSNSLEWVKSATFGHNIGAVAGLLEGSFGFNLEVIALTFDKKLQHYWRDGSGWHEGVIIGPA